MQMLRTVSLLLLALAAAAVGPSIFPAAQAGHGTMPQLAEHFLLPAVALLFLIPFLGWKSSPGVRRSIIWGAVAGSTATIGLEAVRLTGFWLGYMPGNLPRLMGVLLLDRFALGPSVASDLAGWAYHFWNGASLGIIYTLLFGTSRRWVGVLYGVGLGLGFLVSPVVLSLGVGYFGLQFSPGFPITVLSAHAVFGLLLDVVAQRFLSGKASLLMTELHLFRAWRTVKRELGAEEASR